jgi:hypothetical protein
MRTAVLVPGLFVTNGLGFVIGMPLLACGEEGPIDIPATFQEDG